MPHSLAPRIRGGRRRADRRRIWTCFYPFPFMVALLDGLWFTGQEVEGGGTGARLQNLEPGIVQEACPSFPAWKAGMQENRPKGQLEPRVFGDDHQQKLAAGFQHAGGFAEGLMYPVAVQVVDRSEERR